MLCFEKIFLLTFVFILLLNSGCQTSNDPVEQKPTNVLTSLLNLENTDTLPFAIVSDFKQLEPVFNQQNDTTYVINFWATWCAPCVHEFPYFEQLAEETKGQAIEIVMVSLDFDRDIYTKLPRFMKEHAVTLTVVSLVDPNPHIWIDSVDPQWEGSIPITIVYRNRNRKFIAEEFPDYQALLDVVQEVGE